MKTNNDQPKAPGNQPEKPVAKRLGVGPVTREDRLKAALKANMARRKAQAKARTSEPGDAGEPHEQSQGQ
tara:strand:+ start:290 stop:499 length:210 start_codon:yes stop_codon:yes gene_type:complete